MLLIAYAWWQELLLVPGPYWGARTFKKWMHRTAVDGWLVPQPEDHSESIRKLSNRHNRDQDCMVWADFSICLSFFTLLHLLQGSERKDWTNDGRFFNQWGQHPSFDQLTAALRSQLCRRTRLVTLLCIWQPVTSLGDSAETILGEDVNECEWCWVRKLGYTGAP